MLLVYTHHLTPRVKYVFKQIFNQILGVKIKFCEKKDFFINFNGPKISYTHSPLTNELFFESHSILFETGITERKITVFKHQGTSCFFSVKKSILPFDPFAASFFMLSRYEEYLPHIKDEFGRFEAKESLAFKNHFLQKPVVDIWSEMIKQEIQKYFLDFEFPLKKFKYINTIDVDHSFLYLEKGFLRTLGGVFRDLFSKKVSKQLERFKVLMGFQKDPFDTFDYILRLNKEYQLNTIFFFLLGDYSYYDRGIPFASKQFQSKIKSVGDSCLVGIHPSFESIKNENFLLKESNRLKNILHKETTISRQHYIKLNLPNMYRNLLTIDVQNDYSMGFASMPGFRSGTSNSYYFFDLVLETQTDLKIHPFMVMDVTLKNYLNLNPRDSFSIIKEIINEVKDVKGTFISIWHNESLYFKEEWLGWNKVYENIIKYNSQLENE